MGLVSYFDVYRRFCATWIISSELTEEQLLERLHLRLSGGRVKLQHAADRGFDGAVGHLADGRLLYITRARLTAGERRAVSVGVDVFICSLDERLGISDVERRKNGRTIWSVESDIKDEDEMQVLFKGDVPEPFVSLWFDSVQINNANAACVNIEYNLPIAIAYQIGGFRPDQRVFDLDLRLVRRPRPRADQVDRRTLSSTEPFLGGFLRRLLGRR